MNKTILLFAFLMGLFSNFCCKTKDTDQECSKCKPLPPDLITTIRIATIEKTFKVWTGGNGDAINNAYSVAKDNQTSNRAEMSGILEFYNIDAKNIIKDKDLVSVVLYAKGAIEAEYLERNNVLGAVVYTSTPDQTFIHVFENTGSEMKLLHELSSEIWAITFNDLYSIAAVFGVQSHITAWQVGEFKYHVVQKRSNRSFEHKLNKYLNISYLNIRGKTKNVLWLEQSLHSALSCNGPCPGGKGYCVDEYGGEPAYCYPGYEPVCTLEPMQLYNDYEWDDDPRHPFLYDFRDNILGATATGAHIQEDFYYCGSIISGRITSIQAMNGFSLIDNHILPIVKRLNSASASADSSVIFDKSIRDNINAFVADIKTISTDPTFQEILEEVTANVNYCEGKTVAQIKYGLTN